MFYFHTSIILFYLVPQELSFSPDDDVDDDDDDDDDDDESEYHLPKVY